MINNKAQIMRRVIFFTNLVIISIFMIIVGCKNNPTGTYQDKETQNDEITNQDSAYDMFDSTYVVFEVDSINNKWTVEEWINVDPDPLHKPTWWPVAIALKNYNPEERNKGVVKIESLGWLKIQTVPYDTGDDSYFYLDVKGKLGLIWTIYFTKNIIINNRMKGHFSGGSPFLDYGGWTYSAKKIK